MCLYQILLDVDEKAMLEKYGGKLKQTKEEQTERNLDFSNTIGALKKCAHRLKPANSGGGMTWTNIKLRHDVTIEELMGYAKDDFRVEDFGLYIQSVQHYDVKVLRWILHLYGDSEIAFWKKVLEDKMLKKKYQKGTISLRSKAPLDGMKKTIQVRRSKRKRCKSTTY